jgi:hypothetical protein
LEWLPAFPLSCFLPQRTKNYPNALVRLLKYLIAKAAVKAMKVVESDDEETVPMKEEDGNAHSFGEEARVTRDASFIW